MGASKSSLSLSNGQQKKKFESESHVEFKKNANKDGESDYDDEDDSVLDSDEDRDHDGIADKDQQKLPLHGKEGAKMFIDAVEDEADLDDGQNETKQLIGKTQPIPLRKIMADDDSVHQLDKASSVESIPKAGMSELNTPDARANGKFNIVEGLKKADMENELFGEVEPAGRHLRAVMDPQQKEALDDDLKRMREMGEMKFNKGGLLSFNRFMHLFLIITRHSKEQFIKEQRKVHDKRLKAFKLKDMKIYAEIVQHEIDMERIKYYDVIGHCLSYFDIPDECYRASFMKYQMNQERDRHMKDARKQIMQALENKQLESIEFNAEMLEMAECKKILGFYEARKLDVLSILSNPFKHQFDEKDKFVLELAVE